MRPSLQKPTDTGILVYPYILLIVHPVDMCDTDNAGGYLSLVQAHKTATYPECSVRWDTVLLECSVRWDTVLLLNATAAELICTDLNASRPSEHLPVRGKNVKMFRWDHVFLSPNYINLIITSVVSLLTGPHAFGPKKYIFWAQNTDETAT